MGVDTAGGTREFGEFRLDTAKKVLWHGGRVVRLPLKAVELLCVLVDNPGEVVTKNDLMEKVWGEAFVEESVLTQNIYLLRKTLRDLGGESNLIQNVPRRGYFFRGEVRGPLDADTELVVERHLLERISLEETTERESPESQTTDATAIIQTTRATPLTAKRSNTRLRYLWAAAALLLLASAAGAFFYFRNNSRQADSLRAKGRAAPPVGAASSVSAVKTLAVLPLENSDQSQKGWALSDSFADALTSRIASLNKFDVRPFAVVRKHGETGAELKVDYLLDGTIQEAEKGFRVEARVRDVKSGAPLWVKEFSDTDFIRLQDAISNGAAQAILNQLTAPEREQLSKKLPTNIPAYETFQNGFLLWRKRQNQHSIPYFKRAIELDASFARAYAGLASVQMMAGVKDSPQAREAEELVEKALELDDRLPEAYSARGFMRIFHRRDWSGAQQDLRFALELDPNCINARHWLGVWLSIHRRLDEAQIEMRRALEIDPTNPTLHADICQLHYFAGERDAAIQSCQKALELEPGHVFATDYLRQINLPPKILDKESTLAELKRGASQFAFASPYINVDPRYEALRGDSRFQALLRRIGLQ